MNARRRSIADLSRVIGIDLATEEVAAEEPLQELDFRDVSRVNWDFVDNEGNEFEGRE